MELFTEETIWRKNSGATQLLDHFFFGYLVEDNLHLLRKLFFIWLVFLAADIYGQGSIIEFDRPGIADLPYLVPRRTIQIEMGYGFFVDDTGAVNFDNAPGILLRWTPSKIFELRFNMNYMPFSTHFSRYYAANNLFGFGIGGKVKICKEKGLRPELAMTGLFTFSDKTFSGMGPVGGEINLLANNFFTDWFYWNYNVGYAYGGSQMQHSFTYSSCFGFITHRFVELYVEQYAYFHTNDIPDFGIDGGICIFPTPRLQIDLTYNRLFNGFGNQNILNLGVSYNIGLHKDHYENLYWKK
jgi:hypothetical protein